MTRANAPTASPDDDDGSLDPYARLFENVRMPLHDGPPGQPPEAALKAYADDLCRAAGISVPDDGWTAPEPQAAGPGTTPADRPADRARAPGPEPTAFATYRVLTPSSTAYYYGPRAACGLLAEGLGTEILIHEEPGDATLEGARQRATDLAAAACQRWSGSPVEVKELTPGRWPSSQAADEPSASQP